MCKTCGTHLETPLVSVDGDDGLSHVVVFIENIEEGVDVDPAEKVQLDNVGCAFEPHVQSVSVGQTLEIVNSDPIMHNTHAFLGEKTLFNLAMPLHNQRIKKRMKKPGLVHVKCDAGHTWMSAWVYVFEHSYHTVTDPTGQFSIGDVPPGTYQVTAWHEELGTQTVAVDVQSGKQVELTFDALTASNK